MGNQFCTLCGHGVAMDAKFCDDCGAVFQNDRPPESQTLPGSEATGSTSTRLTREEIVKHARFVAVAWLVPFSATLVFGSTLVAAFDFLSPRVALLPIAATVAVVGLLAALALRKFVAPSLPTNSAFRRALAPEFGVHKSPVLIATGLFSALMVSGAAWSSAASAGGGVIASKFDAARNAQLQLGVLQGVQKEQRVQTAVLEDIREGRTLNPRRELANQGILWTHEAFRAALRSGDSSVVPLFLSGGMKWGVIDGILALEHGSDTVASQLLERADLVNLSYDTLYGPASPCPNVISHFNRTSDETKSSPTSEKRAYVLRAQDKKWLNLFCGKPTDIASAKAKLQTAIKDYEASVARYKEKLAETQTVPQCRQQHLADGGRRLFQEGMSFNFPFNRGVTDREMLLSVVSNQLASGGGTTMSPKVIEAIDNYCTLASRKPIMDYNDWSVQSMQQIVSALN